MKPSDDQSIGADGVRGVVQTVVEIAAPPERVFDALTDPEQLARWCRLDGGAAEDGDARWEVDARPDGEWDARTTDAGGRELRVRGTYRTVDPPRRLESTWEASWDDYVPSVVRYDLTPITIGGAPATRLTVTHVGASVVARARAHAAPIAFAGRAWCARLGRTLAPPRVAIHATVPIPGDAPRRSRLPARAVTL